VPDGAGVFGLHETNGVGVAGFGHTYGIGVVGISAPEGEKGGDGVWGISNSENRNGVFGLNDSTTAHGTRTPTGHGVYGVTKVPDGSGVFGLHAENGVGVGGLGLIGIWGASPNGVGVMGISTPIDSATAGDGVQIQRSAMAFLVLTCRHHEAEIQGQWVTECWATRKSSAVAVCSVCMEVRGMV
jgi:hypothetical protein